MTKEVKILGMPVAVETKKDADGNDQIIMNVGKKDFNDYLAGRGLTKEVRDLQQTVTEDLIREGVSTLGNAVCDSKARGGGSLRFGTGNGSLTVNFDAVGEVRVPKTGEVRTKFGSVSVKATQKVPTALTGEGSVIAEMEARAAKVFGKK
jgi:hypothetical protein